MPLFDFVTRAKTPPRLMRSRAAAALAVLAFSFIIFNGAVSLDQVMGDAKLQASINKPAPTVALPTLPPSNHQITAKEYATVIMNQMPLSDKIAQMLMVQFLNDDYSLTDNARMISQQHVGSIILFGYSLTNADKVRTLTQQSQANSPYKLFIATDQEGGLNVNRFVELVGARPSAQDMGANGNPADARAGGTQTRQDFENFGFNMNLAPVVDILEPNVYNPQLGYDRLFSSDPRVVANMADAYLQGLQSDGKVIGTIKHFPGIGGTDVDPHKDLPKVYKTVDQLEQHELIPYEQLLPTGDVHALMVTHVMLPLIDSIYPTSLSRKVVTGVIRDQMHYDGLIVTDDLLSMAAIKAKYSIDQAALLAAEAGSDILIGPATSDEVQATIDTMSSAVLAGQLAQTQVDASVVRILTAKIQMGLIPLPKQEVPNGTPTPAVNAILTPSPTDEK